MKLEDAIDYINYGIKEGYYDPDDFRDWTDKKLIEFAERESARADAAVDVEREDED